LLISEKDAKILALEEQIKALFLEK